MRVAQSYWLLATLGFVCCTSAGRDDGGPSRAGAASTYERGGGGGAGSGGSSGTVGSRFGGSGGMQAGATNQALPGLPETCAGICNAAAPRYPEVEGDLGFGNITMYSTSPSRGGACLYGATQIDFFAAMSVNVAPGDGLGQWDSGRICGQCARVSVVTSQGPKQVVVRIMDKCPDGFCGLDLGGSAPAAVMLDGFGRYDGGWEFVSCAGNNQVFDGPTALFVKDGSNGYWAAVQVRNPPMSVTSMQWQDLSHSERSGGFEYAGPQIENYYLVPTDVLRSGSIIRVTANYRDGSAARIDLDSQQLSIAESSYPFPP